MSNNNEAPRRCKRKGAATGRQADTTLPHQQQLLLLLFCSPSLPRPLRFVPFAISLEEKGSKARKYSTDTTHLPLLQSVVHQAEEALHISLVPPFPFLPPPSAQRTRGRPPPPGGAPSISLSAGSSGLSRSGGAEIRPLGRRLLPRSAGE